MRAFGGNFSDGSVIQMRIWDTPLKLQKKKLQRSVRFSVRPDENVSVVIDALDCMFVLNVNAKTAKD